MKALVTLAPGRSARRATALAIVGLMLSAGQAFADTSPSDSPTDVAVVSAGRLLDADEIAAADVTNTAKGRAALAAERSAKDSLDVDRRPYRVFEFGGQRLIIDATSPLRVLSGLNAAGKHVFDVTPVAAPPL